jgi:hypothetical protein
MEKYKILIPLGIVLFIPHIFIDFLGIGIILWIIGIILIGLGWMNLENLKKCSNCGWDRQKDSNECVRCGHKYNN